MSAALKTALVNVISRGKVALATLKPKRTMIQLLGQAGDTQQVVELQFPYGMSALPGQNADVMVLRISGRAEGGVAIMADDATLRIADLQATEFGFRDARGQQIVFRTDHVEITTTLPVVVNSPTITLGGALGGGEKVARNGDSVVDGVIVASSATTFSY